MVKNSLLELQKDFVDLKDIELKDREMKVEKERVLIFNLINVDIEHMKRFEKEEMKKNETS